MAGGGKGLVARGGEGSQIPCRMNSTCTHTGAPAGAEPKGQLEKCSKGRRTAQGM